MMHGMTMRPCEPTRPGKYEITCARACGVVDVTSAEYGVTGVEYGVVGVVHMVLVAPAGTTSEISRAQ